MLRTRRKALTANNKNSDLILAPKYYSPGADTKIRDKDNEVKRMLAEFFPNRTIEQLDPSF